MAGRWHAKTADDTLAAMRSRPEGLTGREAAERLPIHGPNSLPVAPPVSALAVLTAQLRSVIVLLLAAAIVISLLFDDRIEAAAIAAVLVINTLIGFTTEFRARRAMDALVRLDVPRAFAWRDDRLQVIDARDLVPGDIIEVETGRQVPADGRLVHASDLRADEAPLTGESLPVSKTHGRVLPADTPLAERINMIYAGTAMAGGIGRAVVVATGASTELGRVGTLVAGVTLEKTPLERKLDALGRRLVWLTLAIAGFVGALGLLNGLPLDDVIETAIALAIAAVPEALPAVATIALAVGMHRMARRHALVRRLPAVESLGSATVVCTDKTRTLTSGEMTVVRVRTLETDIEMAGEGAGAMVAPPDVIRLLEAAALASRIPPDTSNSEVQSDPVDRATVSAAARAGVDRAALARAWPHKGLLPFSSDRKLMAAFHEMDGRLVAFVKGAPVAVAAACSEVTPAEMAINERFAADGLRVLAVAAGPVSEATAGALTNLTLLGFLGLEDPPAPGVKRTIATLRAAGLRTVMLTGDQRLTAEAIGRALGVIDVIDGSDTAIDGRELDRLAPADVAEAASRYTVFSRITPEHKLTIVRALQARGEIVAMLGDGVNDAAALKQADVGVAMGGRGTDVAKQVAAIVLKDDRFETIAAAVEEGRVIYDNIRKFVFYLFSCNVAEIFVLLATSLAGLPLPLLPLQLLWLNLATDTFPALALALEPADAGVMTRPPRRPEETVLSRAFFVSILGYGGLITASTMAAFLWALSAAPDRATTVAFMTLAFAQVGHLGNARRAGAVLAPRHMFSNPFAIAGAGVAVGFQMLVYSVAPLAELLRVVALDAQAWAVVIGCALVPAVAGQAVKVWRVWRLA